eukprot:TRINITY_DN14857_c0_g4_i1.p1 TRINITY_DN14857_c0_g4~~TRINITY_DN14857_c0_g4_i1.p1  ORF type:complete len:790 (+),score=278.38 TRINITY_DN14857_c0_g4_i1:25-2394(+)
MARYMPLGGCDDNVATLDEEDLLGSSTVATPTHTHHTHHQEDVLQHTQHHPLLPALSRSMGLSSVASGAASSVSGVSSACLSPLPSQRVAKDVVLRIMSYLTKREVALCMRINSRWREVIHSDVGLIEQLYTTEGSDGWGSVGTPDMSFPEELMRWLSVSEWFRKPLPSQRVLLTPLVMGCGGIIQCSPLAGITTAAIIASLWKAISSRLPQHLVIYCHRNSTVSTTSSVKRVMTSIPVNSEKAPNKLRIRRNEPCERMGLKFNEGTLVLKSVNSKRVAYVCGAARFVGKKLTHVNDTRVRSLDEVARMVTRNPTVTLRFEGRGIADRVFWDDQHYLGGGSVEGVPFSLAIQPYDDPASVTPLEDTISFLTLRFTADERRSHKVGVEEGHRCGWAFCFLARKFRGRCGWRKDCPHSKPRHTDPDDSPDEDDDIYTEVTIKRTPSERLGIKFVDGTLVLKSVNPTLKAHRHGVSQFTGRALTHVNGVAVSTLEEVKRMVDMRTTFVTVEQGDSTVQPCGIEKITGSKSAAAENSGSAPAEHPTTLITSSLDTALNLGDAQSDCADQTCQPAPRGMRPAPIRVRLDGEEQAKHYHVVLRDVHREAGELGQDTDPLVRRSSMLRQQIDLLEEVMCEMMVSSLLLVCENASMACGVAERVGGVVLCRDTASKYNAANNWMEENIIAVPWDCVALAPRASLVVVLAPQSLPETPYFGSWLQRSLLLAGAQPRHPHIPGASLTFVASPDHVEPLRSHTFSRAHAGLLELKHHQVVPVLRPLIESVHVVSDLPGRC